MDELKQTLIDQFGKATNTAFTNLADVLEKTSKAQAELDRITSEHAAFVAGQSVISKSNTDQSNALNRRSAKITEEELNLENKKSATKTELETIAKEVSSQLSLREKITSEIAVLESEKGNKELIVLAIKALESELDKVTKIVTEKKNELNKVSLEVTDYMKAFDMDKKVKEKELAEIKEKIETDRSVILPTIESLNIEKRVLEEKRKALLIIEERYKKLYASVGAGFKV